MYYSVQTFLSFLNQFWKVVFFKKFDYFTKVTVLCKYPPNIYTFNVWDK